MKDKIIIDLTNKLLTESNIYALGDSIKIALWKMFGYNAPAPIDVRGTPQQIAAFANALKGEKTYMETFLRNGVGDPSTIRSKADLDNAIKGFESCTGITWPIR